jgi:hypothetical protein
MACYNEINRIFHPAQQHAVAITGSFADSHTVEEDAEVWRCHYWRRMFGTDLRCDDSTEIKITAKVGISQTSLSEMAGALEVQLRVLKGILSAKLSESETISDERSVEFTRKLTTKKCRGLTFAEWQKSERITVKRTRRFLKIPLGTREYTLENRLEDFCPDYLDYPAIECCERGFDEQLRSGFDTLVVLTFGQLKSLAFARACRERLHLASNG